ncbi:MAG: type II toxin-antitoxin system Phd/YefM family antitoxin [Armatimonadetes bacterium]|nr:type II toxin-antitoxin system Phd/YefM family antitoxin [Armatimonadota bacterium]
MEHSVSVQEARQNFSTLIHAASERGERTVIARHGRPMAVLIPIAEFEQWKKCRDQAFDAFDQIREANVAVFAEQADRDVATAVAEVCRRREGE